MGLLLKWLRLNSLPAAKQATVDKAQGKVSLALNDMLPAMMNSDFLRGADWEEVKQKANLKAVDELDIDVRVTEEDLDTAFQRRLLETERKHYWTQFEQGTLGKSATAKLVEAVEQALDGDPSIGPRNRLFNSWSLPAWAEGFRHIPLCNRLLLRLYFSRLALGYDVARGFIQAQEALESHIDSLAPNGEAAERVHAQVKQNKATTFERIESLRESFPEIIQALQSQTAARLLLNRERAVIGELLKQAVLDKPEAARMLDDVEARMMALQKLSIFNKTQEHKLVKDIPWAKALSAQTREKLGVLVEHAVYNAGETICDEGKPWCRVGIVSRGSVSESATLVSAQGTHKLSTTKGPGESFAQLSLLTHKSMSRCVADTPTDVMWLPGDKLKVLMSQDPALADAIGKLFAAG
ncbi:Crp/Fnr family transcriptional regulator [Motilimonas eburnea]|uniref:Crp/Fnr family transcriptional regulator n=1 Tax=Motilimonas eburnea TaxID=1737488 RepID=UPI0032E03F36